MSSINTVITGNATADPSAFKFDDGTMKATFTVAVNDSYFEPKSGEWKDRKTEYVRVQVRKPNLAEHVLQSIRKGNPVIISGRLSTHEWEGRDGNFRTELVIHADHVGVELTLGIAKYTKTTKNWIDENNGRMVSGENISGNTLGKAAIKSTENQMGSSAGSDAASSAENSQAFEDSAIAAGFRAESYTEEKQNVGAPF